MRINVRDPHNSGDSLENPLNRPGGYVIICALIQHINSKYK